MTKAVKYTVCLPNDNLLIVGYQAELVWFLYWYVRETFFKHACTLYHVNAWVY